jgi:hypothetical protein
VNLEPARSALDVRVLNGILANCIILPEKRDEYYCLFTPFLLFQKMQMFFFSFYSWEIQAPFLNVSTATTFEIKCNSNI